MKSENEIKQLDYILRLVREYASVAPCHCDPTCTCWKHTFEYNLNLMDGDNSTPLSCSGNTPVAGNEVCVNCGKTQNQHTQSVDNRFLWCSDNLTNKSQFTPISHSGNTPDTGTHPCSPCPEKETCQPELAKECPKTERSCPHNAVGDDGICYGCGSYLLAKDKRLIGQPKQAERPCSTCFIADCDESTEKKCTDGNFCYWQPEQTVGEHRGLKALVDIVALDQRLASLEKYEKPMPLLDAVVHDVGFVLNGTDACESMVKLANLKKG